MPGLVADGVDDLTGAVQQVRIQSLSLLMMPYFFPKMFVCAKRNFKSVEARNGSHGKRNPE